MVSGTFGTVRTLRAFGGSTGASGFGPRLALPEPAAGIVRAFPRQALHARLLAFRHPGTGDLMRFEAEPPADMAELAQALRRLPKDAPKS